MTYGSMKGGNFPFVVGGDHSIAIGSIAGISQFYREQNEKNRNCLGGCSCDINTPEIHLLLAIFMGCHWQLFRIWPQVFDFNWWGRAKVLAKNVHSLLVFAQSTIMKKEELKRSGAELLLMRDIDE